MLITFGLWTEGGFEPRIDRTKKWKTIPVIRFSSTPWVSNEWDKFLNRLEHYWIGSKATYATMPLFSCSIESRRRFRRNREPLVNGSRRFLNSILSRCASRGTRYRGEDQMLDSSKLVWINKGHEASRSNCCTRYHWFTWDTRQFPTVWKAARYIDY